MSRRIEAEPAKQVRRAADFSLQELARHQADGFEGYVIPVPNDPQALAERIRVDDVDLWRSFELWAGGRPAVLTLIARRGGRARVAAMGVPTHARRQGWGRRALQVAITDATEAGESLQLEVIASNTAAGTLYASMGFATSRTLIGVDAPVSQSTNLGADLQRISLREAADAVAQFTSDLPWQLDSPSIHALGCDWSAWRYGPSVAVGKQTSGTLTLMTLLTQPEHRRRGHARTLLAGIAAHTGADRWRMPALIPEQDGAGFLTACRLTPSEISQYEMRLQRP